MKTGTNPMRCILKLFFKWGIIFNKAYEVTEKSARKVKYINKTELEDEIIKMNLSKGKEVESSDTPLVTHEEPPKDGGVVNSPINIPSSKPPVRY